MADQSRKAEQFRALHIHGKPLVLFNIWDAGSAKAVAKAGAKAIATSSWSVANANGFCDGERIPLPWAIENLRLIVSATDLPVTFDLESGYGYAPEAVGKTIAQAIEAGAVGCNLEDSFPGDGKLRETIDQVNRIRCARETADAADVCVSLSMLGRTCFSSDRPKSMTVRWSLKRSSEHVLTRKPVRMGSLRLGWQISG